MGPAELVQQSEAMPELRMICFETDAKETTRHIAQLYETAEYQGLYYPFQLRLSAILLRFCKYLTEVEWLRRLLCDELRVLPGSSLVLSGNVKAVVIAKARNQRSYSVEISDILENCQEYRDITFNSTVLIIPHHSSASCTIASKTRPVFEARASSAGQARSKYLTYASRQGRARPDSTRYQFYSAYV